MSDDISTYRLLLFILIVTFCSRAPDELDPGHSVIPIREWEYYTVSDTSGRYLGIDVLRSAQMSQQWAPERLDTMTALEPGTILWLRTRLPLQPVGRLTMYMGPSTNSDQLYSGDSLIYDYG